MSSVPMVIGVLQFELLIRGSASLKDKRRVVRSVKDRLHREHMVSVAEVDLLERLDVASMALACVGGDGRRVGDVLDHVTAKLRGLVDAELGDVSRQVLHAHDLPEPQLDRDDPDLARELMRHFGGDSPPESSDAEGPRA
ncbi:MAG: DUF503 domain-containing protein [Phycisphaerales bacterium]